MAAGLNSIELVDTGTFFVQVYYCPVSLCVTVTILLPCGERGDTVIRARSGRKSQKQNQQTLQARRSKKHQQLLGELLLSKNTTILYHIL